MKRRRSIVFHVDLVQDVAVLKPLISLARRVSDADRIILMSPQFRDLDVEGVWDAEIGRIALETGSSSLSYQTALEAFEILGSRSGLIIAGCESSVPNHRFSHDLFRSAPSSFTTVTLQHGFECVGFLHNQKHSQSSGDNVGFAANIAVGWFAKDRLVHVAPREQNKLFVAGPPMLIDRPLPTADSTQDSFEPYRGMICENMHSVRFAGSASKDAFLNTFRGFAERMLTLNVTTELRPHPAGRYTQRNGVELPAGVSLCDVPLHTLRLPQNSYAVSAPSTILLDFILADVPVGVWQGSDGSIDTTNFAGLPMLTDLEDWWWLANASVVRRTELLNAQRQFLAGWAIPSDVTARYTSLLALA